MSTVDSAGFPREKIEVLGIKVDCLSVDELHREILRFIKGGGHHLVTNVNVNALNLTYKNGWMAQFLNSASINFCDGAGVILGARILGHRIPCRITYADWMWQLAEFAEMHDLSFFFLGGRPCIAEKAANRLREKHPGLRILATEHGYFQKTSGSQENAKVIDRINQTGADILVVAFGMPAQELWLHENWHRINSNVALTAGAAFDFISGETPRGPRWMTANGLEWLARLLLEPRRLWGRYLLGNPIFVVRILSQKIKGMFAG